MTRTIWKDAQFLPESEARVSIYDSALMFGDMVFEMLRTFNKKPFKLDEHLDRLYSSAKSVDIDIPYSKPELYEAHESLLIENRNAFESDDEIRSLINVSRGTLPLYANMGLPMGPSVMMACFPLRWIIKGAYALYQEGVHGLVTEQLAVPARFIDPKIKNRSRLHYRMAELKAKQSDPKSWAILLDDQGFIAEGAGSNFFMVKNRIVHTPEGRNCLRGISRGTVADLCRKNQIEYRELNIEPYDVINADEAFFTCTPYSILPCTKFNFKPVGDGKVGKLTKRLTNLWSESVGCHFVEQARQWDSTV